LGFFLRPWADYPAGRILSSSNVCPKSPQVDEILDARKGDRTTEYLNRFLSAPESVWTKASKLKTEQNKRAIRRYENKVQTEMEQQRQEQIRGHADAERERYRSFGGKNQLPIQTRRHV
jgi:prophage tail gpP-like protein